MISDGKNFELETRNTEQEMKGKNPKQESVKIHAEDSKNLCVSPFPQRISV